MAPKLVDKEQRKREIATAALEVFAANGFESTSISQIATAAGIGKGTVYEYFGSKAELTVAAAAAWVESIEEGVAPLLDADEDPQTRLRILTGASTAAFLEDRRMILLFLGIIQLFLRDRSLLERFAVVRKVSGPMRRAIRQILLDGVSQGVFRAEVARDADRIAINMVAYLDGIGLHYATDPSFFELSEQVEFYLENLLGNLRVPAHT